MIDDEHILLVEDDQSLQELIEKLLKNNNYVVSKANNIEEAEKLINLFKFDLMILDVMLPDSTGLDFYKKRIKDRIKTPVIFLSALSDVEDRISGLELGADDYIGKPFEPKELLLRINNIINKSKRIDLKDINQVGEAKIDLNKMNIKLKEKESKINSAEKKVLIEMISNPGKTYSREKMGKIANISQERSIDVLITRLRQKIEIDPKNPKYLQTIRGSGYVLWIK